MPDLSQLPHLIRLLDDPSPTVQQAVRRELDAYGDLLDAALAEIHDSISAEQRAQLSEYRVAQRKSRLLNAWPSWFGIENEYVRLETALELLSGYMTPNSPQGSLAQSLNRLADEFRESPSNLDSYDLAKFLFEAKGFKGCQSRYYSPERSNLLEAMRSRSGNPISLTCIFMLVAYRLNISVRGCNFPGHFLAMTKVGNEPVLIDCFNRGRVITPSAFRASNDPHAIARIDELIHEPANTDTIVRRVLNNLVNAYTLEGNESERELVQELLDLQQARLASKHPTR